MRAEQIGFASHSGSQIRLRAMQTVFASHSVSQMRLRAEQTGFASHSDSQKRLSSYLVKQFAEIKVLTQVYFTMVD
ncbi:hypothetical protein MKX83_14720 [Cytobacillus sp. FSL M8-0252]|uniref:hypothetical protein n=1 Tax=Cytobacillus sp. FSL M8-0252 TaxID=2921621 RepID=UPI0030FC136A